MVKNTQAYIKILFLLGALEFFISAAILFSMGSGSNNAVFLRYSAARWGVAIIAISCGLALLFFGHKVYQNGVPEQLENILKLHSSFIYFISIILFFSGCILWLAPPSLFGKYSGYFLHIQPLLIVLSTLPFQFFTLKTLIIDRKTGKEAVKSFLVILSILIILFGFITVSKIGLTSDSYYWNVVGMPLTTLQLTIVLLITTISFYAIKQLSSFPKLSPFIIDAGIALLIYIAGAWVWSHTPMLKHYFALRPLAPAFQYFPYSDARIHDLGAIFTLLGYGINAGGYTDKPLYMVFLAILHFLFGDDYNLLSLIHIYIMALMLPALFWFGKNFHSRPLGIAIALITLIRQRNAILLAHLLASVNPRLLVTEMPTLLGLIILFNIIFLWLSKKTISKPAWTFALLAGGVLGAISLLRLNPIGLLPVIVLIAIFSFRKTDKKWLMQISIFILGFLVVFTPWVFTGRDVNGTPYLWLKILDVISVRFPTSPNTNNHEELPIYAEINNTLDRNSAVYYKNSPLYYKEKTVQADNFPSIVMNHSLHNVVTAFLALPDSLLQKNQVLGTLIERPYWDDAQKDFWNGKLDLEQIPLILLNILIVAVGLSWSWRHHKWAGIFPALLFIAYIITLGFARNSGSRYVVPVDWIVFLYYVMGIFIILDKFSSFFTLPLPDEKPYSNRPLLSAFPVFTISILIVLAALVPIAQIPILTKKLPACQSKIINPDDGKSNLVKGKILYPYAHKKSLSFTFLVCDKSIPIDITNFDQTLQHGQTIIIGFPDMNSGEPDSIFIEENSRLIDIWHRTK